MGKTDYIHEMEPMKGQRAGDRVLLTNVEAAKIANRALEGTGWLYSTRENCLYWPSTPAITEIDKDQEWNGFIKGLFRKYNMFGCSSQEIDKDLTMSVKEQ